MEKEQKIIQVSNLKPAKVFHFGSTPSVDSFFKDNEFHAVVAALTNYMNETDRNAVLTLTMEDLEEKNKLWGFTTIVKFIQEQLGEILDATTLPYGYKITIPLMSLLHEYNLCVVHLQKV